MIKTIYQAEACKMRKTANGYETLRYLTCFHDSPEMAKNECLYIISHDPFYNGFEFTSIIPAYLFCKD